MQQLRGGDRTVSTSPAAPAWEGSVVLVARAARRGTAAASGGTAKEAAWVASLSRCRSSRDVRRGHASDSLRHRSQRFWRAAGG